MWTEADIHLQDTRRTLIDTSDEETKGTPIEEVLEGFKLPIYIIQRILVGQKKHEAEQDNWLCNNIFHTRVEYQGWAFNCIVNNDSGMNVLSQEVVNKLQLLVEKHPVNYKLSWVDDSMISVKHQCLTSISLGKHYVDTLHCDVVPIKACHLLLRRPWLYD